MGTAFFKLESYKFASFFCFSPLILILHTLSACSRIQTLLQLTNSITSVRYPSRKKLLLSSQNDSSLQPIVYRPNYSLHTFTPFAWNVCHIITGNIVAKLAAIYILNYDKGFWHTYFNSQRSGSEQGRSVYPVDLLTYLLIFSPIAKQFCLVYV